MYLDVFVSDKLKNGEKPVKTLLLNVDDFKQGMLYYDSIWGAIFTCISRY